MADEQQAQSAEPDQAAVGADAGVTNAAAADVEAALDEETLEDQAEDTGTDDDEGAGGTADAEAEAVDVSDEAAGDDAQEDEEASAGDGGTSAEADEDTGPDVEQDEEGVAEVTDHTTKLLGADEDEGPVPSNTRVGPGMPSGLDPGKSEDRDVLPKPKS